MVGRRHLADAAAEGQRANLAGRWGVQEPCRRRISHAAATSSSSQVGWVARSNLSSLTQPTPLFDRPLINLYLCTGRLDRYKMTRPFLFCSLCAKLFLLFRDIDLLIESVRPCQLPACQQHSLAPFSSHYIIPFYVRIFYA